MKQQMLWAVKVGDEDWQEQIITTEASRIEAAKEWATKNGFNRFRVSDYSDGEKPNFAKTVNLN